MYLVFVDEKSNFLGGFLPLSVTIRDFFIFVCSICIFRIIVTDELSMEKSDHSSLDYFGMT